MEVEGSYMPADLLPSPSCRPNRNTFGLLVLITLRMYASCHLWLLFIYHLLFLFSFDYEVMPEQSYKSAWNYEGRVWQESLRYTIVGPRLIKRGIHEFVRQNSLKCDAWLAPHQVLQASVWYNEVFWCLSYEGPIGKGILNFANLRQLKSVIKG